MSDNTERTLGEHTAMLSSLDKRLDRIETSVDKIASTVSEAKGSWKTFAWLAGLSGAVSTLTHYILHRSGQ